MVIKTYIMKRKTVSFDKANINRILNYLKLFCGIPQN